MILCHLGEGRIEDANEAALGRSSIVVLINPLGRDTLPYMVGLQGRSSNTTSSRTTEISRLGNHGH